MKDLESLIKKLKNLPQYKNKTEEEIEIVAKSKLEKDAILNSLAFCKDDEVEFASELLEEYLAESSIISFSDKQLLSQLIDIEVLMSRIKKELKKEYEKTNATVPLHMSEELRNLTEEAYTLKERLGLTKDKVSQNVMEEWEKLKAKALEYYKESGGSNLCRCPYCQKTFLILKDLKNCHTEKLPLFKKTTLYNQKLFEMLEQNRISQEELATVLGCGVDYIEFIFQKVYLAEKNEQEKK
jgi:adenylate cyclase class IV